MTFVPAPAGGSIPPNKQKGQPLPAVWAQGDTRVHITPLAEARPCSLAALWPEPEPQAREGREPPEICHSPCKASLALASSCSFWASCTLSSVAERTSEDFPPCDSSRSFVNISFICRRRWTSSWSRDTSSRRSTRGEGHRVRGRGRWLTLAHFFWGQFEGALAFPVCSAFRAFATCVKKSKKTPKPLPYSKEPQIWSWAHAQPAECAWWDPHTQPYSLGFHWLQSRHRERPLQ